MKVGPGEGSSGDTSGGRVKKPSRQERVPIPVEVVAGAYSGVRFAPRSEADVIGLDADEDRAQLVLHWTRGRKHRELSADHNRSPYTLPEDVSDQPFVSAAHLTRVDGAGGRCSRERVEHEHREDAAVCRHLARRTGDSPSRLHPDGHSNLRVLAISNLSQVFDGDRRNHNDAVPTPARTDLPKDVERAVDILGNRVRVAILRSLVLDGPASRSELSQRLNLSVSLLQAHLRRLAEFGAISQDPAGTRPDHRKRIYRANHKDVDQLLKALLSAFQR